MTNTNRSDEHAILEIKSLKTYFFLENGTVRAVDGVDLKLDRNTTLGLVGESGCGKSVTALSVMRLIQCPPGKIVEGEILFYHNGGRHGVDIARLDPRGSQMRNIRGGEIAMVFQEPMTSLNPLYTVGAQIAESVGLHQNVGHKEALDRALEMLYRVRIGDPEQPRASPLGLRIPPAMPLRQRGLQPGRATPGRDRARTLRQLPLRRRVESTRDWRLNMSKPRRTLAFLAYLLPVLGWLYVLL
jgi:hypothetical protein